MSSITISGLKSFTLASALVIATTLGLSAVANAASRVPGDFSAASNPNVKAFWVGDCYVEVGVVFDWTPYPNYAHVGGVRVNCQSRHTFIAATVRLMYYDGNRWVQYGASDYYPLYNASGYGNGIFYTPRYCVGAHPARYRYWAVRTNVWTDRAVNNLMYDSYPVVDPTFAGC